MNEKSQFFSAPIMIHFGHSFGVEEFKRVA